jgi:hypothetical protein
MIEYPSAPTAAAPEPMVTSLRTVTFRLIACKTPVEPP